MAVTSTAFRRLRVHDVIQLMRRDDLTIFDMRDEATYTLGHLDGARCLSNRNLEQAILTTPRDKPVLVYCYHGNASQTGAQTFVDFGFREVYDLIGGYESWLAAMARAAAEPAGSGS
jgi:thiosulfate/3-mercaptopyruvate sulfurtransferase